MKLCIIGGGSHSNVVIDTALLLGYNKFLIFDDKKIIFEKKTNKIYAGKISKFLKYHNMDYFIAIGENSSRKNIFKLLYSNNNKLVTLIHPISYVSNSSKIGKGSILLPNTVVNANSVIKKCCIVNTSSTIDHDCVISNFSHIAPGVNIAGNVSVGSEAFIGIGSKIVNNIVLKSKSFITAGTIVKKNL